MAKLSDLEGTTIGLITPSSPSSQSRVEGSVAAFEAAGLQVKRGLHHDKKDRFLAGTDKQRAQDLMRFFLDPQVEALVVTSGGAGSLRLLPYLDMSIIKAHPKPIIGFSDTTSLQLGLYARTGLVSYTGFTCRDIEEFEPLDPQIEQTFVRCMQRQPYSISAGQSLNSGQAQGPIIGGNLSCLTFLMGTPYEPNFEGHILVLEDVWAEPYMIDSMLAQLFLAGVFEKVSGVIFGTFYGCEPRHHPERDGSVDDVLSDWAGKITVPCVKDFPYGHVNSRSMWPIGAQAEIANSSDGITKVHIFPEIECSSLLALK